MRKGMAVRVVRSEVSYAADLPHFIFEEIAVLASSGTKMAGGRKYEVRFSNGETFYFMDYALALA